MNKLLKTFKPIDTSLNLNLQDYYSGVYFVVLTSSDNTRAYGKVVKQ